MLNEYFTTVATIAYVISGFLMVAAIPALLIGFIFFLGAKLSRYYGGWRGQSGWGKTWRIAVAILVLLLVLNVDILLITLFDWTTSWGGAPMVHR